MGADSEACKFGDPFCPCQDGDICHYEGVNPMKSADSAKKLNIKQRRALKRYAEDGTIKYPYELGVRASTAAALHRRGLLKWECDDPMSAVHDWSKYIITDAGKLEATDGC